MGKDGDGDRGQRASSSLRLSRNESVTHTPLRKRATSCDSNGQSSAAKGAGSTVVKAPATVPVEALDAVFEFLDGNGLLSCETVSCRWRLATDRTCLWKRACISAFPHLGDYYFESPYACCSAYEGDWREAFLDGNRANRSAVLDWTMGAIGQANNVDALADGDVVESDRRQFPPFSLGGYSLSLLADPGGNPRAANQAEAAGAPRVEKGLSVYLTVTFPDELPDTPPWGGGDIFGFPVPPPPLPLGAGHPWGASEEEETELEETGNEVGWGYGLRLRNGEARRADLESGVAVVDASTAAAVRRDPHGLRRRRRRCQRREGKVKGFSHAGDPAVVARACCAAFSLSAVNRAGRKDVVWVSSMEDDRFYPGRRSWGVHCLLPTSKMQDPDEGFLKDGSLTVRLRVRLLFLVAHVYTTADLASHRGFGVVPVRGKDQPFQFHGDRGEEGGKGGQGNYWNAPWNRGVTSDLRRDDINPVGPLPCLTFEVLRCTSVGEMENLVARALNAPSLHEIRLWVITQPLTDWPLAPRQLLSAEDPPISLFDDVRTSPSLFRLLTSDAVDETCRVRLWAEQRGDAGFWETDSNQPRRQTSASNFNGRPAPRSTARESFAGIRLACTADMSPWQMGSTYGLGAHGGSAAWLPEAAALPGQAENGAAAAAAEGSDTEDDAAPHGGPGESSDSGNPSSSVKKPREQRVLVFIKTLGLGVEKGENLRSGGRCGDTHGGEGPAYLTHAVLRGTSPLRSLFELTAELLQDGTTPEELAAYIEELPCAWQGGEGQTAASETRPCGPPDNNSCSSRKYPCRQYPSPPPLPPPRNTDGAAGTASKPGASKRRKARACKRFVACPPPLHVALPSGTPVSPDCAESEEAEAGDVGEGTGERSGRSEFTCCAGNVNGGGSSGGKSASTTTCSAAVDAAGKCASSAPSSMSTAIEPTAGGGDNGGGENGGENGAASTVTASTSAIAVVTGTESVGRDEKKTQGADEHVKNRFTTLEEAGVGSGGSICFFRAGQGGQGEAMTRRTYAAIAAGLVEEMRLLLRGEGPLGRAHLVKLPEVVEICESLGYQGFRARIAHDQQRHVNAFETLEYIATGRHLAFICDSCGTQDFSGPRYHCLHCPDYDLCRKCYDKVEPVPRHRYLFTEGRWKREGGFEGHSDDHELEKVFTVPAEGSDCPRRHRQ